MHTLEGYMRTLKGYDHAMTTAPHELEGYDCAKTTTLP